MHEWMTANNQTPHLVVDAAVPRRSPRAYVRDGRITLNVSWQATQGLKLGNEWIEFSARFGGVSQHVRIPSSRSSASTRVKTGQGMLFQDEGESPPPAAAPATRTAARSCASSSSLRRVSRDPAGFSLAIRELRVCSRDPATSLRRDQG
jgi:stringent starvation protein B